MASIQGVVATEGVVLFRVAGAVLAVLEVRYFRSYF